MKAMISTYWGLKRKACATFKYIFDKKKNYTLAGHYAMNLARSLTTERQLDDGGKTNALALNINSWHRLSLIWIHTYTNRFDVIQWVPTKSSNITQYLYSTATKLNICQILNSRIVPHSSPTRGSCGPSNLRSFFRKLHWSCYSETGL